jgi:hypothetical protein
LNRKVKTKSHSLTSNRTINYVTRIVNHLGLDNCSSIEVARHQGGIQHGLFIFAYSSRASQAVNFSMHNRIALLHALIMSSPNNMLISHQNRAYSNSPFTQTLLQASSLLPAEHRPKRPTLKIKVHMNRGTEPTAILSPAKIRKTPICALAAKQIHWFLNFSFLFLAFYICNCFILLHHYSSTFRIIRISTSQKSSI